MYRCALCGSNSEEHVARQMVVVETRDQRHPGRHYVYRGEGREDRGGFGKQIVREVGACKPCAETAPAPRHAALPLEQIPGKQVPFDVTTVITLSPEAFDKRREESP